MRLPTLLRRLLGFTGLFVQTVHFETSGLIARVRPSWKNPRCGRCGAVGATYDTMPAPRRWQHLPFGRTPVLLQYQLRRVDCRACRAVVVERVPWAAHDTRHTLELEELVAFLAQITDKSTAARMTGISWASVDKIVDRIVQSRLDPQRFEGLTKIGIDEFSYRKRHRYVTIVVDHERRRVVWAQKGRSGETLDEFFALLGPERTAKIEVVTMDMAESYIGAVKRHAPQAEIVFDRFHVQRLMSNALDEVRRELMRGSPDRKRLFKHRFALQRSEKNRTEEDCKRLADIQKHYKPLFRAWTLKERLGQFFDTAGDRVNAAMRLRYWLAWAARSRLKSVVKVGRTIKEHVAGVLAYFDDRLTNGLVEGINNRLRMIARRAFGYHSARALIAMLFLCCGGIELDPPLPGTAAIGLHGAHGRQRRTERHRAPPINKSASLNGLTLAGR